MVDKPLPLNFSVISDEVTNINVEVLEVSSSSPADFGFASFNFSVVETFFFQMAVFIIDSTNNTLNTVEANLQISGGNSFQYNKSLRAGNNLIELREDISEFRLSVFNSLGEFEGFLV